MLKRSQILVALSALLIGCGVPDDALISDLSSDEVTSLCEEVAGDDVVFTCEGGSAEVTVSFERSVADCEDTYDPSRYEDCDVTAGDVRTCEDAYEALTQDDVCDESFELFPDACDPIYDCLFDLF